MLIAHAELAMSPLSTTPSALRYVIAVTALVVIIVMVTISTRRDVAIASPEDETDSTAAVPKELEPEHTREVPIEQSDTKVDKLAK